MKVIGILSIGLYFVAGSNDYQLQSSSGSKDSIAPKDLRILGGVEAPKGAYPWVVALVEPQSHHYPILICGGSIITTRHVLTAGHCLESYQPNEVWIAAGKHRITEIKNRDLIQSKMIIIHENYYHYKGIIFNDIALLLTRREIKYSTRVGPVCLTKTMFNLDNEMITALGWGHTTINKLGVSDTLQQLDKALLPMEKCANLRPDIALEDKLCFSSLDGRFVYNGDSGGPFVWKDPETGAHIQVGVQSYEDKVVSVSTYVTAFADWIEDSVTGSRPEHICWIE